MSFRRGTFVRPSAADAKKDREKNISILENTLDSGWLVHLIKKKYFADYKPQAATEEVLQEINACLKQTVLTVVDLNASLAKIGIEITKEEFIKIRKQLAYRAMLPLSMLRFISPELEIHLQNKSLLKRSTNGAIKDLLKFISTLTKENELRERQQLKKRLNELGIRLSERVIESMHYCIRNPHLSLLAQNRKKLQNAVAAAENTILSSETSKSKGPGPVEDPSETVPRSRFDENAEEEEVEEQAKDEAEAEAEDEVEEKHREDSVSSVKKLDSEVLQQTQQTLEACHELLNETDRLLAQLNKAYPASPKVAVHPNGIHLDNVSIFHHSFVPPTQSATASDRPKKESKR